MEVNDMNDETDKGKLNKFICKNYTTDEKGDISLWSLGWQSIEFIIAICVIGVLICFSIVILGAVVFTLPGFIMESVYFGSFDVPFTALTVVFSIAIDVVIIVIILLIKFSMKVKVAHCPVKEESEHNEPKEKKKSLGDEFHEGDEING